MAIFCCVAQKAASAAHWFIIFFNIPANFRNEPNVIFRGLGEDDSQNKAWSQKSRGTVPLKVKSFFHIINTWPCEKDDKIRI